MKYITAAKLKKMGACEKQLRLFRALFGVRAYVSFDNMMLARTHGMPYLWLVNAVLNEEQQNKLAKINEELHSVRKAKMQALLEQFINGTCGHEEAHFLYYDMNDAQETYVESFMQEIVRLLLEVPD